MTALYPATVNKVLLLLQYLCNIAVFIENFNFIEKFQFHRKTVLIENFNFINLSYFVS